MKLWTQENLIKEGYVISNCKITRVDLSMEDHGCLTLEMVIEGDHWGFVFGGYALGHGFLGADNFEGSAPGLESIMRIMDVVGVERFNDMKGRHIRVASKGINSSPKIIGDIIEDLWFDIESFFADKYKEKNLKERNKFHE